VRNLEEFELAAVSGGDHWGYENADGGIDEASAGAASASYASLGNMGGSSAPSSLACTVLGSGAGIAAGLITTGGLGIASVLTAGVALPGAGVAGTVVGGIVGGAATYRCNNP